MTVLGWVGLFLYPKSASVSITTNTASFELYDSDACTIPVNMIDFGTLMEKSYSGETTLTTASMWIKLDDTSVETTTGWECDDLPPGMTLTGEYRRADGGTWTNWSTKVGERRELTSTTPWEVRWTLDVGSADLGDHVFNINLVSGT
ncbi:unnamed protein product, partial [marine sediment metagenome]